MRTLDQLTYEERLHDEFLEPAVYATAQVIVRDYVLNRLDEIALLSDKELSKKERAAIQNVIDRCKRLSVFESFTDNGFLEDLYVSLMCDDIASKNLIRGIIHNLCTGLTKTQCNSLCVTISNAIVSSAMSDSPLVAKYKTFPNMEVDQVYQTLSTELWLLVCVLIRYTSFIDEDVED